MPAGDPTHHLPNALKAAVVAKLPERLRKIAEDTPESIYSVELLEFHRGESRGRLNTSRTTFHMLRHRLPAVSIGLPAVEKAERDRAHMTQALSEVVERFARGAEEVCGYYRRIFGLRISIDVGYGCSGDAYGVCELGCTVSVCGEAISLP